MQSERVLVETRHGTMHARTLGIAGVPLVLSHMSPLSGSMFTEVAPRLARTRRVILPDRIGFGHSDPPPGPLTIADYADSTLDMLDELGIENFDVVGMHTGSDVPASSGFRRSPPSSSTTTRKALSPSPPRRVVPTSPGTGTFGRTSCPGARRSSPIAGPSSTSPP